MFTVDMMSRIPVYEQIIEQMERLLLCHILGPDDQVPSVRSLSIELSINPNTIQKAYTELTRRELIYSVPGKGCFVSSEAVELLEKNKRANLDEYRKVAREFLLAGIEAEELIKIIQEEDKKQMGGGLV